NDDSVSFTAEMFPSVEIIRNHSNRGYAGGYNETLKDLSEEIWVLLNNDVEVSPGWLDPILDEFAKDPKLVAAQPKILDYKNKDCFEYAGAAGGFIDSFGYPFCRGRIFDYLEKDEGQYNDTVPIFWATGACLFVRKVAFEEVDGFDEDFFAHQEEIDLCWRLQSKGGQIKYFGNSTVYHLGGGTLDAAHPKKTFYNFRNTLLALVKNVSGLKVWWIIFLRLWLDGAAAFLFLLKGKPKHFWAVFRAHLSFYGLSGKFLKKRKQWASRIKYSKIKSVVWKYFILKKRNFIEL
ncbi:MAG: glycosyltransferase family 2 protein, partial [Flavobacteriaceae bacterium]|nr:glycosyltransferase family 2 protein [Flavobacteriaceae bacterium]